jgi:hypothetical protein
MSLETEKLQFLKKMTVLRDSVGGKKRYLVGL